MSGRPGGTDGVGKRGQEAGQEATQLTGIPKGARGLKKGMIAGEEMKGLHDGDASLEKACHPEKEGKPGELDTASGEVCRHDKRPRGQESCGEVSTGIVELQGTVREIQEDEAIRECQG